MRSTAKKKLCPCRNVQILKQNYTLKFESMSLEITRSTINQMKKKMKGKKNREREKEISVT